MILNIDKFIYGGDYNPEQWLIIRYPKQDLLLMKKAHINTVTLGAFRSTLEPIKDCFNFTWLIDIIDKSLYDNGIQVILIHHLEPVRVGWQKHT